MGRAHTKEPVETTLNSGTELRLQETVATPRARMLRPRSPMIRGPATPVQARGLDPRRPIRALLARAEVGRGGVEEHPGAADIAALRRGEPHLDARLVALGQALEDTSPPSARKAPGASHVGASN